MVLEQTPDRLLVETMVRAVRGTGSEAHLDHLIELIGRLVPHDFVWVLRYSVAHPPVVITHRNFSDAMVRRYMEVYYVYDPFSGHWRSNQRAGVITLNRLARRAVRRGPYVSEFMRQSVICDELGVLLEDGQGWCLGIFLDRRSRPFTPREVAKVEAQFPIFAALHEVDARTRRLIRLLNPGTAHPNGGGQLPPDLWPELSARERQIVELVIAGHPSASISRRLGITPGTVKNHRRHIYEKLDITTERELFLQYVQHISARGYRSIATPEASEYPAYPLAEEGRHSGPASLDDNRLLARD